MKMIKRLVIMNKIKFILIALFTTLLISCKDCIFCWDCGDLPQESYIHFDNAGKYNIVLACRSSYKDSVNHVYYPPYISEFNCTSYSKMTGIEILKSFKRRADEGRDIVNGDTIKNVYYLLFMNRNEEVVLAWDLRDTTQRWADESLWTVDSSFHEICGGREMQVQYHNTYTFSDEDFAVQQ